MRSLVRSRFHDAFFNHPHLFNDATAGSSNDSASVAAIIPSLDRDWGRRLSLETLSSTAELAAIQLALQSLLLVRPLQKVVIYSATPAERSNNCSPNTIQALSHTELRLHIAGFEEATWDVSMQWVPSHCDIPGNERTDCLAASQTPPISIDAAINLLGNPRCWLCDNGLCTYAEALGSNPAVGEIFLFLCFAHLT